MSHFLAAWQAFSADAAFFRAYRATYAPPAGGGDAVPNVRVLLDDNVQQLGEYGVVTLSQRGAHIAFADVPEPQAGGTLTIGSRVYTLDRLIERVDEDVSTWSVV